MSNEATTGSDSSDADTPGGGGTADTSSGVNRQAGPPRGPAAAGEGVRIVTAEEVAAAAQARSEQRPSAEAAGAGGRPPASASPAPPAARFPLPSSPGQESSGVSRPRPVSADAAGERTQQPSGVTLPHWTEPPTGQVPSVVAGSAGDEEEIAGAAAGPRWKGEHEPHADDDFVDDLAHDGTEDVGALDPGRPSSSEAASFDDLDMPAEPGDPQGAAAVRPGRRPGPLRGSARGPGAPRRVRPGGGGGDGGGSAGGVGGRDMGQAVTVGVALAAVGLFLAWLGAPWLLVLLEVIIVLAGAEYLSALRRAGLEPPTLLGLVAVAALPLVAYARGDAAFPMVLVLLVVFSMVWFLVGAGGGRPVRDIGTMLLAVVHVGVFGAFGALILRLGPVGGAEVDQGVSILLLAVVAAVFYDVGGLFAGSRFGRTPLSAASPNKTREGLIGGLLASVVAVLIAVFFPLFGLTTFGFVQAVVFALVCAVAAFVGDLAESLIKRDLGVKDMGDLLPGHGGVLDRFDGMLFVMPAAYYVTLVLFA